MSIKIVRVVWGMNPNLFEIPTVPLFEDETVLVWGVSNLNFVKKLGYTAILISENYSDPVYSTPLKHFGNKLLALRIADLLFDEYLFLDWDITLAKPIDNNFYETIRAGNDIQCPIYGYSKDYEKEFRLTSELSFDLSLFIERQVIEMNKYNWKYKEHLLVPCFCFFYSRNNTIISDLINITEEHDIVTCIEEFALWYYLNCSLNEYINIYEPRVLRGKENKQTLDCMSNTISIINEYVSNIVDKDIYLLHDII
jgi:hypothetical protein